MTPEEMKILRRVCAQFKTGIRKPFKLRGANLKLIVDVNFNGLCFEDVQNQYNVERLSAITPDAILTAISMFEVRRVMES